MKDHITPLLAALREQKEMKMKGGIYHKTQIDLTYNSNHIEGSRLTHDQTRYIFETNTIGVTADETMNVNDIIETVNHFRCIDLIIDKAEEHSEPFPLHRPDYRQGRRTAFGRTGEDAAWHPEIRHIRQPQGLVCRRRLQTTAQRSGW